MGNDFMVFVITTSSTRSARLILLSWTAACLNICLSVHSNLSCRAGVAASVHTSTVFIDGLTLFFYQLVVSEQKKKEICSEGPKRGCGRVL